MREGQGGPRSVFVSVMGMDENIFHLLSSLAWPQPVST